MASKKVPICINHKEPQGHRMFRMLTPLLLLLLSEKSSYGYNLIERLGEAGVPEIHLDPGAVYKTLRQIQEDGLVESDWKIKSRGAPTRIYKITPAGEKVLHQWVEVIKRRQQFIDKFLNRCYKLFKKG